MSPLNYRQAQFAEQYIIDFSATHAAVRAGYAAACAAKTGWKLLQIPHVQEAIREQLRLRSQRTHITQDRVLQELARVAFFDPRKLFNADGSPKPINELDDATAAAIGGIDVQEVFEGAGDDRVFVGYTKKYKVWDKNVAIANAMKHLGMLKDSLLLTGANEGPVEVNVKHGITVALSSAIKARLKKA